MIFVLVFASCDLELGGFLRIVRLQKVFPISMKFGM